MASERAYLSIGSNMGQRQKNLANAVTRLRANPKIEVVQVSSIYETEPVGGVKQDDFLNIAVAVQTNLTPTQLLGYLHQIEQALHRKRLVHWGPRTIDLDILLFGNLVQGDETLTLPHPEMQNRKFVLIPLLEITRDDEKTAQLVKKMLLQTNDETRVQKYNDGGASI